ncbi:glucose-1-phosphate cytidylyltransferase [Paenibacillus sp. LMG 31459]|uniref:Glucose-1-phosphate cytidylyltransferase n=1 Tax=Paenibacillus phytohabitans TaxID=2654978 RepID=A0ABX1YL31_9BACL|nr:glucose-1-phosphate cytidylyltransferase [Paenibacillus phytohabitans]NOU81566.1 glucose-1-phosphate cytidylyltransferase [Paenibacillus phytohabitans]
MKVVILAGGYGTRISEETELKPKPMIEIGDRPILVHIMEHYASYGFDDFVICLGYKGHDIKKYFADFYLQNSDISFDYGNGNQITRHNRQTRNWKVTLAETGKEAMTGGRIRQVQKYTGNEPFMLTYGDGIADVDVQNLLAFHQSHGKWATITAVQPPGRFGALEITGDDKVEGFVEKPKGDEGWINGGFFVLQPEIFSLISDNSTVWEQDPLRELARRNQLMAYKHHGFWQPMDTLRDKRYLEQLWREGGLPWMKSF